jgi:PqqD family protein of HPr-rel-A system
MSTTSQTWQRDTRLPFQKLDEDTIVVDPATRAVHLLNETAARVWELLDAPRSIDELVAALTSEYDAAEGEVRGAVEALLGELAAKGVLVGA